MKTFTLINLKILRFAFNRFNGTSLCKYRKRDKSSTLKLIKYLEKNKLVKRTDFKSRQYNKKYYILTIKGYDLYNDLLIYEKLLKKWS